MTASQSQVQGVPAPATAAGLLPMKTVLLPISEIHPYPRNPRRIPTEAVEAVAESIKRYGYQQPIVVDADHTIVVGHTRHQALLRLGWTEVPVYVTDLPPEKVAEYRLVDNRTSELTTWDYDALVMELREFEETLLTSFFPEIDLEVGQIEAAITANDVASATKKVAAVSPADPANVHTTQVVCPACFHTFDVRTRSLPGLTSQDLDALAYDDGEAE